MKKLIFPLFALGALILLAAPGRSQGLDSGGLNPVIDVPPTLELPTGVPNLPLQGPIQIKRPDLIPVPLPGAGGRYGVRVFIGATPYLRFAVRNIGTAPAPASITRIQIHRVFAPFWPIANVPTPPLAIGGVAVRLTPMPNFLHPDRRFFIKADFPLAIPELNEFNNAGVPQWF